MPHRLVGGGERLLALPGLGQPVAEFNEQAAALRQLVEILLLRVQTEKALTCPYGDFSERDCLPGDEWCHIGGEFACPLTVERAGENDTQGCVCRFRTESQRRIKCRAGTIRNVGVQQLLCPTSRLTCSTHSQTSQDNKPGAK